MNRRDMCGEDNVDVDNIVTEADVAAWLHVDEDNNE